MRLRRLRLPRYGLFTDAEIDFGARPDGAPDLHIVYGPNETGKSTALSAYLDLLFSIEHKTRYAFLHRYDAMRVEADVEIGGQVRRFARIKRRRDALRDGGDRPVADDAFAAALGGMDRAAYKTMFSLDDDTLEAGGEEILESEGRLGQLLFAGGAGLVELGATLRKLRAESETFRKGKARDTKLHELKSALDDIAERKKTLDIAAHEYVRLIETRDGAQKAYDEIVAEIGRLEAQRKDAQRRLRALPALADIRRLRDELAGLESLPEPPPEWSRRIGELIVSEPRLAARIEEREKTRARLAAERDAIPADDAILEAANAIAALDFSRFQTAEDDLPRRREAREQDKGRIAAILRRLDRPADANPAALVVPAAVAGALGELIERRAAIGERLKTAANESADARAEYERAAERIGARAGADSDARFDLLKAALAAARRDDSHARVELRADERRRLEDRLRTQAAQLRPWTGDPAALAAVRAPEDAELAAWKERLAAAEADLARLETECARLAAERKKHETALESAKAEAGIADDAKANVLRAVRDEAWTRHRSVLDDATADAFEARMTDYDSAADRRLAQAAALAGIRGAAGDARATAAELERNDAQRAAASARRDGVRTETAAAVRAMNISGAAELPPDIPLAKLAGWVARRAEIMETLAKLDEENAAAERAREAAERLRARLAGALSAVGAAFSPDAAAAELAEAAQEAASAAEAARKALERAAAERDRREAECRRARAEDEAWREAWTAALARCWMRDIHPEPSATEVRALLRDSAALEAAAESHADLAHRIAAMERDRDVFADGVRALAERLGEDFDPARAHARARSFERRLAEAKTAAAKREDLRNKSAAAAEECAAARRELAELRAEAGRMYEAFGVDSLLAVQERLQAVARRAALRKEAAARETRLVEDMNAASLADARAALAGGGAEELEARIEDAAARLKDAAARRQEKFHELRTAADALADVGGDDAAARLESERRAVILEIEDRARNYMRMRLGAKAAELALDAWREEHRGAMMKGASEAFRTISRGAYARLAARLTEKGEVLIGVPADGGGDKLASEMSKGARFQLYLALRVAGYLEFVRQHGPVPFIADDILETFDDFRAEEAFRLFAEMALEGQTIYLSHHRHLCDIAREVCPSVRIHELPDPAAPARAAQPAEGTDP